MLDAIAEIDNLGMEDSTFAADTSTTSLDTNTALGESQGSSIQSADFDQSLVDMISGLETLADGTNPSLKIVSGQSLEDALADAIPGLDPTTITPPAPLAEAEEDSLPSLDAPSDDTNPSLRIVSGQSLEDALADAIPGLDPTTVTPPPPLAEDSSLNIADDSSLNPFMMAALSELDDLESIGDAFQSVSDGFEGLSNSLEQLAASFLTQDSNVDTAAIDSNTDADLEVKNIAAGDKDKDTDTSLETDPLEIKNVSGENGNTSSDIHAGNHSSKHSDKAAIASLNDDAPDADIDTQSVADVDSDTDIDADKVAIADVDADDKADKGDKAGKAGKGADDLDVTNIGFGLNNVTGDDSNGGFGFNNALDPDFDFDALKVNVDQVSKGLQFLVQQLEAAFESDDSALTTEMLTNVSK